MARPSILPFWANDNDDNVTDPTDHERRFGLGASIGLRRQVLNWMFKNIHQWLAYLDSQRFDPSVMFGAGRVSRVAKEAASANLASGLIQAEGHITVGSYVLLDGTYVGEQEAPAHAYADNVITWWLLSSAGLSAHVSGEAPEVAGSLVVWRVVANNGQLSAAPYEAEEVTDESIQPLNFRRLLDAMLILRGTEPVNTLARTLDGKIRLVYGGNGLFRGGIGGPAIGVLINAEIFFPGEKDIEESMCRKVSDGGKATFFVLGPWGYHALIRFGGGGEWVNQPRTLAYHSNVNNGWDEISVGFPI